MTPLRWAILAGVAVGVAYTLSPLTVVFGALLFPLWRWASDGLTGTERRWVAAVFAIAVVVRFAAIASLFMSADATIPYANFFGDEEFFKRRTTWLRNLGMGIPISPADYFYTFDETGDTGYLYLLTYVQALFGLAPYGVHVMNAVVYLSAAFVLYRFLRPSFGGPAVLVGLSVLLFLPSLFSWSISALKEPLYFFVAAMNIVAVVTMMRTPRMPAKMLALLCVLIGSWLLQSLREGGLAISAVGVVGGLTLAFLVRRPRLLLASVVAAPIVLALALTQPRAQEAAWTVVREAAYKHWGHVNTPGLVYKNLDEHLYRDRSSIATMTAPEAGRFVVRALVSYVTVPQPWRIESRAALAFLPEQMIWYLLILLVPIGAVVGLQRDPLVASLLIAHGAAVSLIVALSGGNVGTLVRHRDLSLPFIAWLAGLGAVTVAHWLLTRYRSAPSPLSFVPSSDSKAGLA